MERFGQELIIVDDPEIFDGCPIGLQIVGRRFDDERIVGIVKYLQEVGVVP